MEQEYFVIGRGRCGWHAKGINLSSDGGTLEHYLASAVDGALIYDAEGAELNAFVRHVVGGPMVDPSLPSDGVKRFGLEDRKAAARMLPGLSGGFEVLAKRAIVDPEYGGFDYVGVGVYEDLLRKIPGMRVGHVHAGVVTWNS